MRNTEMDVGECEMDELEYFSIDNKKKFPYETFAFFVKRITIVLVVIYALSKFINVS